MIDIINKYQPTIISDQPITIDDLKIEKQMLDITKISTYYQNKKETNPHLIVPNYLKLPQALEEKK